MRRARPGGVAGRGRPCRAPVAHIVLSQVLMASEENEAAQSAADEAVRLGPDDSARALPARASCSARGRFADAEVGCAGGARVRPGGRRHAPALRAPAGRVRAPSRRPGRSRAGHRAGSRRPGGAPAARVPAAAPHPKEWTISEGSGPPVPGARSRRLGRARRAGRHLPAVGPHAGGRARVPHLARDRPGQRAGPARAGGSRDGRLPGCTGRS